MPFNNCATPLTQCDTEYDVSHTCYIIQNDKMMLRTKVILIFFQQQFIFITTTSIPTRDKG